MIFKPAWPTPSLSETCLRAVPCHVEDWEIPLDDLPPQAGLDAFAFDERPNHPSTRAADGVAVHRHAVVERLVLEQIELKRPVELAAVEGVEERPAGAEHGGVGEEQ